MSQRKIRVLCPDGTDKTLQVLTEDGTDLVKLGRVRRIILTLEPPAFVFTGQVEFLMPEVDVTPETLALHADLEWVNEHAQFVAIRCAERAAEISPLAAVAIKRRFGLPLTAEDRTLEEDEDRNLRGKKDAVVK